MAVAIICVAVYSCSSNAARHMKFGIRVAVLCGLSNLMFHQRTQSAETRFLAADAESNDAGDPVQIRHNSCRLLAAERSSRNS